MESFSEYEILKYFDGQITNSYDPVITEYSMDIVLNDKRLVTLLCTPKSLKELTAGFLFSEGIIRSKQDILNIRINEQGGKAYITIENEDYFSYSGDYLLAHKAITTACGKRRTVTYSIMDIPMKLTSIASFDPSDILRLMNQFSKMSDLFNSTGGVHSCALCTSEQIIYFEEDIGRHNALDKIIGRALLESISLADKYILTTGRISSEIITKVMKMQIGVIASRSAPTNSAIEIARQSNIVLIGFARGRKLNIYNGVLPENCASFNNSKK